MDQFAIDVREGLTRSGQKILYSKYLYDAVGSGLFEVITQTQEYGLTRADERILHDNAGAIIQHLPDPAEIAELGSGGGRKTRWLLEALAVRGQTTYFPIDISEAAIVQCEMELGRLPLVEFRGVIADYLTGLERVEADRETGQHLLVLFLGSSIGNFDRPEGLEFLRQVRGRLRTGDLLLLGTDLMKPEEQVIAAYDDAAGVTAAFNKNILSRINHQLGGNFDLSRFAHTIVFNRSERRIEMHLKSLVAQTVTIADADLEVRFEAGETIWTESSYKFMPEEPKQIAEDTGFRCRVQWIDEEWPFAESLFVVR